MTTSHTVSVADLEARLVPVEASAVATAFREENGEWTVEASFVSDVQVDRPNTRGWGLGPKHEALANRLVRAINDGVIFSDFRKGTDVNGHTYITATSNVLGRTLNADLRRLGY